MRKWKKYIYNIYYKGLITLMCKNLLKINEKKLDQSHEQVILKEELPLDYVFF